MRLVDPDADESEGQTSDTQVEDILTEVMTMIQMMLKKRMPLELKSPSHIQRNPWRTT